MHECMTVTHVPETGAGKMESIYGAGFWNMYLMYCVMGITVYTVLTLRSTVVSLYAGLRRYYTHCC